MKQIKNLIRKKVLFFAETSNIEINPEFKQQYLKNGNTIINNLLTEKSHKNENNHIETILEEDENLTITGISEKNFNHQSSKDKPQSVHTLELLHNNSTTKHHNNKKRMVNFKQDFITKSDIVINKKFNKHNSEKIRKKNILKNSNKTLSFKEYAKKENNNNTNIDICNDKITKDKKETNISNKINQINNYNYNINIFAPKVEVPLEQINNIENKTSIKINKEEKEEINNSSNLGKINSEISVTNNDFMIDIKDNNILMENSDENSNILYSNIKLKRNDINADNINDKYQKNIIELLESKKIVNFLNKKNKQDGTEIKTNDKISIKSVSSDKSKIDLKNKNNDNQIINKSRFNSLSTFSSTSFTLNSSYENINAISNFKYNSDSELREKTKQFILEQINPDKIAYSHKVKNNKITAVKSNMKSTNKKFTRKQSEAITTSRKNLNKIVSINVKPIIKRSVCEGENSKIVSRLKEEEDEEEEEMKDKIENNKKNNFSTTINGKKRKSFKTKIRKNILINEKDNTFYNKINRKKTLRNKRKVGSQDEYSDVGAKTMKMNYNQIISKNIEKNQQNLNNPEEYFEGFFNNIIFNNKGNNILSDNALKKKKTLQKRATE